MYISKETPEETDARLCKVLATATLKVYESPYFFRESKHFEFDPQALAMVKDDEVWSYLVPATSKVTENFQLVRFHFQPGLDNSGFVGWLSSKIKTKLGSGVLVVCGQNAGNGGIFDYYGCPLEVGEKVIAYIHELRAQG